LNKNGLKLEKWLETNGGCDPGLAAGAAGWCQQSSAGIEEGWEHCMLRGREAQEEKKGTQARAGLGGLG